MSRRRMILHFIAKAAMLFAALFVVTVLLAAIPAHRPPIVSQRSQQLPQEPTAPANTTSRDNQIQATHKRVTHRRAQPRFAANADLSAPSAFPPSPQR